MSEDKLEQNQDKARRRVVVVVGPGRSGTSTLTGALRALSVDLGNNLKRARRKNARGFFEDLDLLDINHRLLTAVGLHSSGSSVGPIDPVRWNDPQVGRLHQEAVQLIRQRFGNSPLWGFKCGGMIRVLPFWENVLRELGFEINYLIAIRNPLNMATSRSQLDIYRGTQEKSDAEWLAQIIPHFSLIAEKPFLVVDYDQMVDDSGREVWRIGRLLGIEATPEMDKEVRAYAEGFVTGKLRHHRASLDDLARDPRMNPLTRDAYTWLLRMATDSVTVGDPAFRADWQRIERSFNEAGPLLRHIDFLENELRRRLPPLKTVVGTVLQHLPVAATLTGGAAAGNARQRRAAQDS